MASFVGLQSLGLSFGVQSLGLSFGLQSLGLSFGLQSLGLLWTSVSRPGGILSNYFVGISLSNGYVGITRIAFRGAAKVRKCNPASLLSSSLFESQT